MEMSGQLHTSAALPPYIGGSMGLHNRSWLYGSVVQRSYVLGHNSLMPMEVRAPPHYYYYYYYHHNHHLIRTTPTPTAAATTTNNNNKIIRIKNGVVSMGEKNRYKYLRNIQYCTMLQANFVKIFNSTQTFKNVFCLKI
jgi:hypothetical protein